MKRVGVLGTSLFGISPEKNTVQVVFAKIIYQHCSNVVILKSKKKQKINGVKISLSFSFSEDMQYCLTILFFEKQGLFCMCQCKVFAQMVDL